MQRERRIDKCQKCGESFAVQRWHKKMRLCLKCLLEEKTERRIDDNTIATTTEGGQ